MPQSFTSFSIVLLNQEEKGGKDYPIVISTKFKSRQLWCMGNICEGTINGSGVCSRQTNTSRVPGLAWPGKQILFKLK